MAIVSRGRGSSSNVRVGGGGSRSIQSDACRFSGQTGSSPDAEKGNLLIACIAKTSTAVADGATSDVTRVYDNWNNTWTKVAENTNYSNSTPWAGTVALWYAICATNRLGGMTSLKVTADCANVSVNGGIAMDVWGFVLGPSAAIVLSGSASPSYRDGTVGQSMSVGSLSNSEHLWMRLCAVRGVDPSPTSTWTEIQRTIGDTASSLLWGEFLIATATSATSTPTFGSSDSVSMMHAFSEGTNYAPMFFGAGPF